MFLKIVINDFFILKPRELGSKENSVLKKKIYDKYLQKVTYLHKMEALTKINNKKIEIM